MEKTDAEMQAYILMNDFSPSGNLEAVETYESQINNEEQIEKYYYKIKQSKGIQDELVLIVFFKLFDIWIGLYRLHKCDKELSEIYPACKTRNDQYQIKAIQALAFTRWKQSRFVEAISLFEEMEKLVPPSASLYENMGHTFNSLGRHEKAEEYFNKALPSTSNRGGVLLGLGLLKDRRGHTKEALPICLEAYEWYKSKFQHLGDSSLMAKSGMSVSKLYHKLNQLKEAEKYAAEAVEIFVKTCGETSPLVGNARKELGDVYMDMNELDKALHQYEKAYEIEAIKDNVCLVSLMEIHNAIIKIHLSDEKKKQGLATLQQRFRPYEDVLEKAYQNIKTSLPQDGNSAVYYKLAAELYCLSGNYQKAVTRFDEAMTLFRNEKSCDCSDLIQECQTLYQFAFSKLH
eukprot:TRINITY_DN288_c0_g1_i3.p1 TRINITY_DN288_c0_g1~~TRINITY_DN288_c0_g1_i3.p1  ORF type:complete len:420 (-),score=95.20 TRINITY_DN288_c0_g1_i3:15-1223(-)